MAIAPEQTIKDVITDFLASGLSVDDIIAYRLPKALQPRAQYRLDKNHSVEYADAPFQVSFEKIR